MSVVTPADLLRRVAADLTAWAGDIKGYVEVADDELSALDALTTLGSSPANCHLVVSWEGEKNLSDVPDVPMMEQTVSVLVSAHRGLAATVGKHQHTDTASRDSLLELVAKVTARMLGQTWDAVTTDSWWRYKGAAVARLPDGTPLRAYKLTFTLDCTMAAITDHTVSA